jgi:phosphoenolpyruvate synthase/pyruvate phosphate dikinase
MFEQFPNLYSVIIIHLFHVEEGGIIAEPLDKEKVSQLCLTKEEALAVGHLGVQLEQMFGGPRDIEWAVSKVRV